MNFSRISIVVPSFNQGQYLEETLLSIINQEYPNLEIFVVDGGSTDNSVDIIKKYEQHITWWVSEKDNGQSDAINKGLKRATGTIVSWLCSDDLYTPGTLKKVAEYFSSFPENTGLIHGGTILFKNGTDILKDWGYENPSIERNLAGMAFSQPSAFFLKKYLDIIGNSVKTELHFGMDYELYCRFACVCRFQPVKDIFSRYRLHNESKSLLDQDKFITDWSKGFINLCKNLKWQDILDDMRSKKVIEEDLFNYYVPFSFQPDIGVIGSSDKRKILFYHYCYILKAFYWTGQIDRARQLLKNLKLEYPIYWLKEEKDVPSIMKKLVLPGFVLQILKKAKRML